MRKSNKPKYSTLSWMERSNEGEFIRKSITIPNPATPEDFAKVIAAKPKSDYRALDLREMPNIKE